MADERMSDGEIRRSLDRQDRRIDDVVKAMVTVEAWNRENLHMQERIREGDEDCKDRTQATNAKVDRVEKSAMSAIRELQKRKDLTLSRILIILTILATLLAGYWAAFGQAKGIH